MCHVLCKDDGSDLKLGRVNLSLVPQEILMERFIDGLHVTPPSWKFTKKRYLGLSSTHVSICTWEGIICDKDQIVRRVLSGSHNLAGSLHYQYLPRGVHELRIGRKGPDISGDLDLLFLPESLKIMSVQGNAHNSTISLGSLPSSLTLLNVSDNQLHGELDLTHLPDNLTHLLLNMNLFSGSISLTQLPEKLKVLRLDHNHIEGPVDLTSLPTNLTDLILVQNRFSGTISLEKLPLSLLRMRLDTNRLQGPLNLQPLARYEFLFGFSFLENYFSKDDAATAPYGFQLGSQRQPLKKC